MTFSESWTFIWQPKVSRKNVFSTAISECEYSAAVNQLPRY
jgi:hypothetical protein